MLNSFYSSLVQDIYLHSDIAPLAEDINAFYEYLERGKSTHFLTLSLYNIIPLNFKGTTLPDFISSNDVLFYYDTNPGVIPVITPKEVWFNAPEITDKIDLGIDVNEILKGLEEYKIFLKGFFAAR